MKLRVTIHNEAGTMWATVVEYPGVFATGDTMAELLESLGEGLAAVVTADEIAASAHLDSMEPVAPERQDERVLQFC